MSNIRSLFHSQARVLIIAGLLVIASAIFFFLYQKFLAPEKTEKIEIPQTNPFEEAKTNPFKDIKTNPFD